MSIMKKNSKDNELKNWTKVDEYAVKDDHGNDVVFGTYCPDL